MTVLNSQLSTFVTTTFGTSWTRRDGRKVPDSEDLPASNTAVELEGTVLYADLAESTGLVRGWKDWFAADVYKTYLYCASRVIADCGGTITAFDGDRVMGVFIGDSKNTNAAKAALKINWATNHIIKPEIARLWPDNKYVLRQKVGIDTSKLFIAKTGVRGTNDLVWVGNAANNAAKMAALDIGYRSYITEAVYNRLSAEAKYGGTEKKNMWTQVSSSSHSLGYTVYGSTYEWGI